MVNILNKLSRISMNACHWWLLITKIIFTGKQPLVTSQTYHNEGIHNVHIHLNDTHSFQLAKAKLHKYFKYYVGFSQTKLPVVVGALWKSLTVTMGFFCKCIAMKIYHQWKCDYKRSKLQLIHNCVIAYVTHPHSGELPVMSLTEHPHTKVM